MEASWKLPIRIGAGAVGAYAAWRTALAWSRRYDFQNRVVVITGGSRGLGLALAERFAAEGARVAICARDQHELDSAREQLERKAASGMVVACDLTRPDDVADFMAVVRRDMGPVDVLVNNAGIIEVGPIESLTLDDFEEAMAINFWAALYATKEALPDMRGRRQGRIVNITSVGGLVAVPHLLPYCASKFALVGMSDGLRCELTKDGIYVTTVCPGMMRTGSPRHARFKGQHRAEFAWFSILGSLPVLTISAERAAHKIVNACRFGRAKITLGLSGKLAAGAAALAPELVADLTSLASRLLPAPGGIGTASVPGAHASSEWSPSWLTTLNERAAARLNENFPP